MGWQHSSTWRGKIFHNLRNFCAKVAILGIFWIVVEDFFTFQVGNNGFSILVHCGLFFQLPVVDIWTLEWSLVLTYTYLVSIPELSMNQTQVKVLVTLSSDSSHTIVHGILK